MNLIKITLQINFYQKTNITNKINFEAHQPNSHLHDNFTLNSLQTIVVQQSNLISTILSTQQQQAALIENLLYLWIMYSLCMA